ncbi:MAG: hypothetical protein M3352_08605 [Bacteroidota bacterium]|nr:hypothetical protein [Bacteroidota bacterium]
MKKFIVQTMLVLGFVLSYGFSYAQTPASCCPQKGTADCPLLKNCPKKGTKDCPYAVSTASLVAKNVKADCPLAGTPDCPIEKCPLKGTKDCPLVKNTTKVSYAVNKKVATKSEENLPLCCRKSD